jgi:hypothetical protein
MCLLCCAPLAVPLGRPVPGEQLTIVPWRRWGASGGEQAAADGQRQLLQGVWAERRSAGEVDGRAGRAESKERALL